MALASANWALVLSFMPFVHASQVTWCGCSVNHTRTCWTIFHGYVLVFIVSSAAMIYASGFFVLPIPFLDVFVSFPPVSCSSSDPLASGFSLPVVSSVLCWPLWPLCGLCFCYLPFFWHWCVHSFPSVFLSHFLLPLQQTCCGPFVGSLVSQFFNKFYIQYP